MNILKGLAVLPAIIVLAGSHSMAPAGAPEHSGRAERIRAASNVCPSWCTFCHALNNDMWSYPDNIWPNNDGYFGCSPGACSWGDCPESEEQMTAEEFGTALVIAIEGSAEEIAEILGQHPRRVQLNESRSAIQIKGCRGEVVAHIPIEQARLDGILQLENSTR
jgi:hypothetical protein